MTQVDEALKPCPFCGSDEHLFVGWVGSLTGDMPDRPYRVSCNNLDHDTVTGPVAYGRHAAIAAWNTRATPAPSQTDTLRLALLHTQMMLEQIAHLKSTDFAEVHRRILANRKALGGSHD
ncbi:hypothetical protein [Sphingomonas sp.]|uniref:hypothetical protein n=1 Tax=Sphingomonas sp. TaxID=28214 RepID=UPI003BADAE30